MSVNTAKNRLDYQPPAYVISQVELEFELLPSKTRVLVMQVSSKCFSVSDMCAASKLNNLHI